MIEERFVVHKTDWHVQKVLQRIYNGRLPDFEKVLFTSEHSARKQISRMNLGVQELYSVYRVKFDKDKIIGFEDD